MLRDGRVAEALPAAREMYKAEPGNIWNLRALIRALCKGIWESHEAVEAQPLATELNALPALSAGDDDAQLTAYRERAVLRADPLSQRLWAIREASKNGNRDDALRQLRQLHREFPQRTDIDESLAWEVWHAIVEARRAEQPDRGLIRNLLLEYRQLRVSKPSMIHSRILDVAALAAHDDAFPSFCGFLKWWDPSHLRDEDFQANPSKDGKPFPSVVEHVIQGLGKVLKREDNQELIRLAGVFIESHYKRYPEQEKWFPYYLARAWIKCGRTEDARTLLLPVVRRNQSQSWAWQQLAACFEETDPQCVSCRCRALLCPGQEAEFLVKIRLSLAQNLLAKGMTGEAKFEVDEVVRVRKENNWPIRDDLLEMTRSAWYHDAMSRDGSNHYREWAENATEILVSGLPWHDAVLGVKDVPIGEHKNLFAILDIRHDTDGIVSVPVKMKAFAALSEHPIGTTLAVQMDTASDRPLIVGIRYRNGVPWDIVSRVPTLILRVNAERGITVLMAEDGVECLCYHNDVPAARTLTPGTIVACAMVKDAKRTKVRDVSAFGGAAQSAYWKNYQGSFRPRENGGGHVGDVFAHARFTCGFIAGTMVRGIAVKTTDAKTRRSWWEAVNAKADAESSSLETGDEQQSKPLA